MRIYTCKRLKLLLSFPLPLLPNQSFPSPLSTYFLTSTKQNPKTNTHRRQTKREKDTAFRQQSRPETQYHNRLSFDGVVMLRVNGE
uniref:Uncharacterized protein n=1 Tax=Salix viminalis TaxID=40686 RepID=A0A6N2L9X6_SALVM